MTTDLTPERGEGLTVGRYITFHPAGDHGNAVISPGQTDGVYWTLIGVGPDDIQNRQAAEIVRRLNLPWAIPSQAAPSPVTDEVVAVLRELADDLEAEIQARAAGELPRRIARDMGAVIRDRSLLAKLEVRG